MHALRNLGYSTVRGRVLRLDAYLPSTDGPRPGVVVIHGGGWSAGSKESVAVFARRLAAAGWAAFAVDYRLAPGARFPAPLVDVRAAIRWIAGRAVRFRLRPPRLALFGFSAGATLALAAGLTPWLRPDVAAVAAWSAPTDLTSFARARRSGYALRAIRDYLGCALRSCPRRYREASPVSALHVGAPPLLLANSTGEIVPLAQAREFLSAARRLRVPGRLLTIPGSHHAAEYAKLAWEQTLAFLRRYLR